MWNQFQNMFSTEEDSRLDNLDETFTSFCRSPLHIAAMSGDVKLARKILSKVPEGLDLALKQDSNGFTPLHLACVRTSVSMVRLLLEAKSDACIVQDQDGRTPLHLAAMKNQGEVMKVLMEEGLPEAIHLRNHRNGETILHFCVKSNTRLKTLKLLVNKLVDEQNPNPICINSTDNGGNTILHLAAKMGNMKITNYLLLHSNVRIDINVANNKRLKALDILSLAQRNDLKFGFYGYHVRQDINKSKTLSKNGNHEGMKDRINALVVVATLIAGIAFQAATNPPGGVWQDDSKVNSSTDPVIFAYYLDRMFGSSIISGGLDRYIQDYLQYPTITNSSFWVYRSNSTIGKEQEGTYPIDIEYLVKNLRDLYYYDIYYYYMTLKGLMLEDFVFTEVVSYYNNSIVSFYNNNSNISSHVGFFPYLIRYAGFPILAYTYPTSYVIYIATNGVAFLVSLAMIFLVVCGFTNETSVTQVRVLVVLMCISIGCIAFAYLAILEAMVPEFYTRALDVYFVVRIFLGICCMLGVGYFIWSLTWKIVKLRKRTRRHHIGVINYFKTLFFGMDVNAAGKLVLFIACYAAYCLIGYFDFMNTYGWPHTNPFLY
ncbi:hypothetical protein MKW92_024987 [Papaver armeniacum]|nr:hypothetical protein MKW92_024987 [Papaver armeniacum]